MLIICLLLTWAPFSYLLLCTPNPAWISCSSVCIFQSCSLQVCGKKRYVIRLESLRRAHPYKMCYFALCAVSSLAWLTLYSASRLFGFVSLMQKIFKCDLVFRGSWRQLCVSYLFLYFLLPAPTYGVVKKERNGRSKEESGNTREVKACFASLSL